MPHSLPYCRFFRVLHAPQPACARLYPQRAQLSIRTPGWPQGDEGHQSGRPRREPIVLHTSGPAGLYKWRSRYLQREHGRSVTHVATDNMALDGEHPAFALHAGKAVVARGPGGVTGWGCSGRSLGFCSERFKHAQSLGLDALPASSDLNRPAANPRVPRGEGRAEGGASRRPRPSGQRDLWNPAHELLPLCSITWPHIPFCRSVCASGGSPVSHSTARYFQYTLFHLLGPRC